MKESMGGVEKMLVGKIKIRIRMKTKRRRSSGRGNVKV